MARREKFKKFWRWRYLHSGQISFCGSLIKLKELQGYFYNKISPVIKMFSLALYRGFPYIWPCICNIEKFKFVYKRSWRMDSAVSKRFTEFESFDDGCQFCIFVCCFAFYIATTLGIHIIIINLEVWTLLSTLIWPISD